MDAIRNGHSGTISSIFVLKQQFVDSEVKCLFFPVGKKIWVLEWIAELKLDLTFPRTVGGGGNFV